MQLILDGRSSNSANRRQLSAMNRPGYRQTLMDGKPKPNNSELVVRNWYNPNLDYKLVCGALADRHDHHYWRDDRHFAVVAREREQGTLDQLLVSPLSPRRFSLVKPGAGADCRDFFEATIVLAIGIWAYQIPFAGSLALFISRW